MLASALPLFENVPGTFADPLGLADQQAAGVVALIVARYDDASTNASIAITTDQGLDEEAREEPPHPPSPANRQVGAASEASAIPNPSSPTYDTFVAASGGLVAVARTTPDYRFPVAPATAVARFHAARDAGHAPSLSLFSVSEADATHFLETAFYAECLKVHVEGTGSADLVRAQLARCGCADGLLEANDFSDPAAPTVRLAEVFPLADPPLDLDAILDGVHGRVLLYDRAKNQAVAADRASAPLDLDAAIAQADRLARARRPEPLATPTDTASPTPETEPPDTEPLAPNAPHATTADDVEADLRQRAEHSAPPSPLSALVAELQGRTPPPEPQEESPLPSGEGQGEGSATADEPGTQNSEPAAAEPPHPLAPDLDRLRTDSYALLEAAVGRDRAAALDAHVRAEHGWASPVPSEHTLDHLRALLFDNPPKRWHLFKRARAKTHGDVAALLLAFHAAHGHDARPLAQEAVMHATQLWTRLHK